jgi:hypothetical protein
MKFEKDRERNKKKRGYLDNKAKQILRDRNTQQQRKKD